LKSTFTKQAEAIEETARGLRHLKDVTILGKTFGVGHYTQELAQFITDRYRRIHRMCQNQARQ